MKIVVCIRQGLDGEINPFDACAYEAALCVNGAEVILLSMGPMSAEPFLKGLTRLGAGRAILLSDKAFAGSDTLATAYALSLAIKKLSPNLVFCGRQTLVGDTGQVGPMTASMLSYSLISNVMSIDEISDMITCTTRKSGMQTVSLPALLTIERINTLRFPSLFSKMGTVEVWSVANIGADIEKCGLAGSPTRVIATYENSSGKRKCKYITLDELPAVLAEAKKRSSEKISISESGEKLKKVFSVGEDPLDYAKTVSDDITVIEKTSAEEIATLIEREKPSAVLFASDEWSKQTAAEVAAKLSLGLCADCTALVAEEGEMIMLRPALSGSIIAKIKSLTKPAMATVRTTSDSEDMVVAIGYGAKNSVEEAKKFASSLGATLVTTRKMVDNSLMPYEMQVGLTGKTISPDIYVAVGVSGAVHHIVGMQRAGTVIAINPDKNAPIFEYADYGVIADADEVLSFDIGKTPEAVG